jgi:hypothetical protein
MSVLSDVRLLEKIYDRELKIEPFVFDSIQPSSIDLTLDNRIRTPKSGIKLNAFNADIKECFEERILDEYTLKPGDFIIGQVKENIGLSKRMTGLIQNRKLSKLYMDVEVEEYLKEYNKKSTKEIDKKELIDFLEQRIKAKAIDALKGLTNEEKQKIGLL